MNRFQSRTGPRPGYPARAKQGGAALLVAVLFLVTLMATLLFGARVTSFEQVISGNDRRAKLAHHAAEAGINHAIKFFTRNARELSSVEAGGWLEPGGADRHWVACSADDTTLPCSAAPLEVDGRANGFNRENVFYYVQEVSAQEPDTNLPLDTLVTEYDNSDPPAPVDSTAYTVQALLCVISFDQQGFEAGVVATYPRCDPSGTPENNRVVLRVVATGVADDGSSEALISQTLGNAELGGPPVVPIMTFNDVEPNGTVNVVPNPNAGGLGVPVSIWSRNYIYIEESGSGSIATCELEEFLNTRSESFWRSWIDSQGFEFVTCDSCVCPDKASEGALSHTQSTEPARKFLDVLDQDADYPDDIFEYYFGVARSEYPQVRDAADMVLTDCSTIDTSSQGMVWVDGYCDLSGREAGSATAPLVLIATAGVKLNSNSIFYGVLLVTDPTLPPDQQAEDSIEASLNGGPIIYGAIMTDPGAEIFNGGFTVVYMEDVLNNIPPLIVFGNLSGSWTDQLTFN